MSIKKIKKEELELLSNKEITHLILENSKKPVTTADLFKQILELKELPASDFESKIGDYYMALSTDKNLVMLKDGRWDLRNRHTSDTFAKAVVEDDEDLEEVDLSDEKEETEEDETAEDSYDDNDNNYDDNEDDLKNLVVIDEDDLETDE